MGVYLRMQSLHFNVVLYGTPYSVLASWKVSKFENRAIITCLVTKHTGYLPCDIFDTSFFLVLRQAYPPIIPCHSNVQVRFGVTHF